MSDVLITGVTTEVGYEIDLIPTSDAVKRAIEQTRLEIETGSADSHDHPHLFHSRGQVINENDLNNVKDTGFYFVSITITLNNVPINKNGYLWVWAPESGRIFQEFIPIYTLTGGGFTRECVDGVTWTSWSEGVTTTTLEQYSKIDHTHTLEELGAAADDHTHTLEELGAAAVNHTHTPEQAGAAPADHLHTPEELGVSPDDHTHTAEEVGAADRVHTHDYSEVGVVPLEHTHTPEECSAAPFDHLHTPEEIGASPNDHVHIGMVKYYTEVLQMTSFDTITETGFYRISELFTTINAPENTPSDGYLWVWNPSGSHIFQQFMPFGGTDLKCYIREYISDTWTPWTNTKNVKLTDEQKALFAPAEHTHDVADIGAAPLDHTHTAEDVGASPDTHSHTLTDLGAAAEVHTHTLEDLGAAPVIHTHDDKLSIDKDTTGVTDLNNLTTTGYYLLSAFDTTINIPIAGTSGHLWVWVTSDGDILQQFIPFGENYANLFVREYDPDTEVWTTWGKLSGDIETIPAHTHTIDDLSGVAPEVHSHTLADLGAASTEHSHLPIDINAADRNHSHTLEELSAADVDHTHDLSELNVASTDHKHDEYIEMGSGTFPSGDLNNGKDTGFYFVDNSVTSTMGSPVSESGYLWIWRSGTGEPFTENDHIEDIVNSVLNDIGFWVNTSNGVDNTVKKLTTFDKDGEEVTKLWLQTKIAEAEGIDVTSTTTSTVTKTFDEFVTDGVIPTVDDTDLTIDILNASGGYVVHNGYKLLVPMEFYVEGTTTGVSWDSDTNVVFNPDTTVRVCTEVLGTDSISIDIEELVFNPNDHLELYEGLTGINNGVAVLTENTYPTGYTYEEGGTPDPLDIVIDNFYIEFTLQKFIPVNSGKNDIYIRYFDGAVWSPWDLLLEDKLSIDKDTSEVIDLNDIKETGYYYLDSSVTNTNTALTDLDGYLWVWKANADHVLQQFIPSGDKYTSSYVREFDGIDTWSTWKLISGSGGGTSSVDVDHTHDEYIEMGSGVFSGNDLDIEFNSGFYFIDNSTLIKNGSPVDKSGYVWIWRSGDGKPVEEKFIADIGNSILNDIPFWVNVVSDNTNTFKLLDTCTKEGTLVTKTWLQEQIAINNDIDPSIDTFDPVNYPEIYEGSVGIDNAKDVLTVNDTYPVLTYINEGTPLESDIVVIEDVVSFTVQKFIAIGADKNDYFIRTYDGTAWSEWFASRVYVSLTPAPGYTTTLSEGATSVFNISDIPLDGAWDVEVRIKIVAVGDETETDVSEEWYIEVDLNNMTMSITPYNILENTEYNLSFRYWQQGELSSYWTEPMTILVENVPLPNPVVVSPINDATDILEQPTMQMESFTSSNVEDEHLVSQYQVATDSGFTSIVYDTGEIDDLLSHRMPDEILQVSTTYYFRMRQKSRFYNWSNWVSVSATTLPKFEFVVKPTIESPTENEIITNIEEITVTSSLFATLGALDDQDYAQWQIATDSEFTSILDDSGDNSLNFTQHTFTVTMGAGVTYYLRARHHGVTLGWSDWSDTRTISTLDDADCYINFISETDASASLTNCTNDTFNNMYFVGRVNSVASIIKTNNKLDMVKQVTLPNFNYLESITSDSANNLYVVGHQSYDSVGNYDITIVKLDINLNIIAQKRIGGTGYDKAYSIHMDNSDNLYVTGYQKSNPLNVNSGYIVKLDNLLNVIKEKSLDIGHIYKVQHDSTGNLFLVFNQTTGTYGSNDAVVMKLDTDLAILKQKVIGSSTSDFFKSLTIDGSDNVYCCGSSREGATSSYVGWLAKFDNDLNLLGQKKLGDEGIDVFSDMCVDGDDNLYTVGSLDSAGIIIKFDSNLNILKQKALAGDVDYNYVVEFDSIRYANDKLYITGGTNDIDWWDVGMLVRLKPDLMVDGLVPDVSPYEWKSIAYTGSTSTQSITDASLNLVDVSLIKSTTSFTTSVHDVTVFNKVEC